VASGDQKIRDDKPGETVDTLLARYPMARLSAVTADGTPVLVPSDVNVGEHHVLSGTAGMQAYVPHDRSALIEVFDRALRDGYARGDVHLVHDPNLTVTVHMFDTLQRFGVVLAVGIPAANQDVVQGRAGRRDLPPVQSRLARVYKSRTAEILAVDRATTDILGWRSEDMVGKRSLEFIHPDDQGLAIESWAVLATEPDAIRRVRIRHRSSGGDWIWFDVAHSASVWQGEDCFIADMIDVSQEMATQQALEAREQLLAQLAQALPLGVFQIDSAHRFRYTNDCLFTMMGTTGAADFDALLQWVATDDREALRSALRSVMNDDTDLELSVRVEPTGGPPRVCQFTLRRISSVAPELPGAVGCVVDITEQTAMRRELEDKATFDPLTRCYNRATIMSLLDLALSAEPLDGARSCTAVVFIDLDRFKEINDRFGHHIGDELLVATAGRLRCGLRPGAAVGRLGGDEFLVLLPDIGSETEAIAVAQRLADSLHVDVALSVGLEPCRASVGLAVGGSAGTNAETLVNQADAAMYEAKARRDGRAVLAATTDTSVQLVAASPRPRLSTEVRQI
jgi:diguanylate cyclase (GGDEF)-like protein/PAS domain S-box-containing protein